MDQSRQLSAAQVRGLRKAGDILIPGGGEFPSFSRSGALTLVDRMLEYMNEDDLNGVKALFSLFAFLPRFLIRAILALSEHDRSLPGPLGSVARMINLGIKGIVMTLYYSEHEGRGTSILELIHWDAKIVDKSVPSV